MSPNRTILPAIGIAAVAPLMLSAAQPRAPERVQFAQLTIRERIIIRIPKLSSRQPTMPPDRSPNPRGTPRPPVPVVWNEKKAPRCIPTATLAGATFSGSDVDLAINDGRRIRAKLDDDCPTLNFYGGFYLQQTADGMTCAKRDAIRSRSGRRCEIARFRTLVPRK